MLRINEVQNSYFENQLHKWRVMLSSYSQFYWENRSMGYPPLSHKAENFQHLP